MEKFNSDSMAQQAPQQTDVGVHQSVNRISLIVGAIVAWAMWVDGHSVTVSMLAGVGFYLVVAVLLITAPFLTAIIIAWQREVTIRRYNALPYEMAQDAQKSFQVVDQPRIGYKPTTPPLRLPESPRYVPAIPPADERLKLACYSFVRDLFDEEGRPIPKRILGGHTKSPSLVQYEKPKPDVVSYLLSLQMVWENERKQLFFNVEDYPTLRYCMTAINLGVPQGREGVPPLLHEKREAQ